MMCDVHRLRCTFQLTKLSQWPWFQDADAHPIVDFGSVLFGESADRDSTMLRQFGCGEILLFFLFEQAAWNIL